MKRFNIRTVVPVLALAILLPVALSGCVLLGLGAAAVGGCAVLDRNDDDQVTQTELSRGLFEAWDEDGNSNLTEPEFEDGVARGNAFNDLSGDFDEWDEDDDGSLTMAEFQAGFAGEDDRTEWVDSQCDDLGL